MDLSPAVLTLLGTLLVVIGGLLGALINARSKREEGIFTRLQRVEEKELKCQRQLFQIKTDMQTLWLGLELILKDHPEAKTTVMEEVVRMKARQKAFLSDEDTDAERLHTTEAG